MNVRSKDPSYPPPQDIQGMVYEHFSVWLMSEIVTHRWVALVDDKVAGHISMTKAHPYLTDHLKTVNFLPEGNRELLEISKFFVNPLFQGHGIGTELLHNALSVGLQEGYIPSLAVIASSTSAIEVYRREEMLNPAGHFHGIHGKNYVFIAKH